MQDITTKSLQRSGRHDWKHRLIWGGGVSLAIAVGSTAMFLGVSPDARALAASAVGKEHGAGFAHMHGGTQSHAQKREHFDKLLNDAGANGAQKQQIHDIMKTTMTGVHADMQRYHGGIAELTTLLSIEPIDDAAITALRAENDRLAVAASRGITDGVVASAKVLTPAQRVKLAADIDRMMESHKANGRHD